MKKTISIILALVMALSVFSVMVLAETPEITYVVLSEEAGIMPTQPYLNVTWDKIAEDDGTGNVAYEIEFKVLKKSIISPELEKASLIPSLTSNTISPSFRVVVATAGFNPSIMPSGKVFPSTIFIPLSFIINPYGEPYLIKSAEQVKMIREFSKEYNILHLKMISHKYL